MIFRKLNSREKGLVKWLLFNLIGAVSCIPILITLAFGIIFRPRRFFHRTKWSSVNLPSPFTVPVHSEMIKTSMDVFIHVVKSFRTPSPKRELVLLVHGFPEYSGSWRHQINHLSKKFDIAAMDLRGYGLSCKPDGIESYSVEELASDVASVMQTLGNGKRVVLVGHDWGGAICWHVAHQYQYLIERLVIACAPHPRCFLSNMTLKQFFRSWYMFFFLMPQLPETCFSLFDHGIFDEIFLNGFMGMRRPGSMTEDDTRRYKKEFSRPGTITAALNYYRYSLKAMAYGSSAAAFRKRRRRALRGPIVLHDSKIIHVPIPQPEKLIVVPTLVLWADHDGALGKELLRGIGRYVHDLRGIEVLKNCSHWIQQDAAVEFNSILVNFIQSDF